MEPQTQTTQTTSSDHDLILQLLAENQQLLKANHEILLKQEHRAKVGLIAKIVWYALLLGLPLILYYFLYNTLMDTLTFGGVTETGASFNTDTLRDLIEAYQVPQ